MKIFKLLWLFCIPGLCYAQQKDSLDTISVKQHVLINSGIDYKPKVTSFIIPAVFISYGLVSLTNFQPVKQLDKSTKDELQEDHPLFAAHADNYLQFAPAAAVYALNLAGVKGKHNLVDATGLYVLSEAIMGGTVTSLKKITHRQRPDESAYDSFPSGHTANAFAAAEFLNQEYKDVSPWIGYAGYTVATATGVLRLYNNKHWVSDVVAGAGFGILSTKVAYYVYPKLKRLILGKNALSYNVMPSYQQHSFGLSFNGTF